LTTIDDNARGRRREAVFLAMIVALAAMLRLMALYLRRGYLGFDESMFIILGKNLLSGNGYRLNGLPSATFPFGMPLISGAFWRLTGSAVWAAAFPTALFGALAVVPLYLVVREFWGRLSGFVAAILYAGTPSLLMVSPFCPYAFRLYAGSEGAFIFFVLFAGYLAVRAMRKPSATLGLALGFLAGAAFEVRQDALGFFAVFLAGVYLYPAVRARRVFHWDAFKAAAWAAVAFAVMAAPFVLWVKHVTGRYSMGPRFAQTFRMRRELETAVYDNVWGPALKIYFQPNEDNTCLESPYYGVTDYHRQKFAAGDYDLSPRELVDGMDAAGVLRAWRMIMGGLMPRGAWILVVVGLISAVAGRRWRLLIFAAGFAAPTAFVATALYTVMRFYVPFVPVMIIFAARGADLCGRGLVRIFPGTASNRRLAAGVYFVVPFAIALTLAQREIEAQRLMSNDNQNYELMIVRRQEALKPALAEHVAPGSQVVAFAPALELRSEVEWLAVAAAPPDRLAEYCYNRGADFLLLRAGSGYWEGYTLDEAVDVIGAERVVFDGEFAYERFVLFDMGKGSSEAKRVDAGEGGG
jgi:4-amino-4-deoxy-L-arabinose transferase-like glycosyltransferase